MGQIAVLSDDVQHISRQSGFVKGLQQSASGSASSSSDGIEHLEAHARDFRHQLEAQAVSFRNQTEQLESHISAFKKQHEWITNTWENIVKRAG